MVLFGRRTVSGAPRRAAAAGPTLHEAVLLAQAVAVGATRGEKMQRKGPFGINMDQSIVRSLLGIPNDRAQRRPRY